MLVNYNKTNVASHVKFVSYTGKWPNLCDGIVVLEIDGKEVKFGSDYIDETVQYDKFWKSGGHCSMRSVTKSEWEISVSELPEEYRQYAAEIDAVFNANVEYGCCGGCR